MKRLTALTMVMLAAASLCGCRHANEFTAMTCPSGATLMGAAPPKGQEVWCQKTVNGKPVKDGIFIAWGDGTDKLIQGTYRDGVQEGEWTTWYASGQIAAVDHYHGGEQNGLHTSWYFNGVKAIEGNYKKGRREGIWSRWDPTGLTSKQEVYKDGKKVR